MARLSLLLCLFLSLVLYRGHGQSNGWRGTYLSFVGTYMSEKASGNGALCVRVYFWQDGKDSVVSIRNQRSGTLFVFRILYLERKGTNGTLDFVHYRATWQGQPCLLTAGFYKDGRRAGVAIETERRAMIFNFFVPQYSTL